MARLVWAADGEWKGEPVKAGELLPPMLHQERGDLYTAGRAVRAANGDEAAPTPPAQVDPGALEPVKESTEDGGELHELRET